METPARAKTAVHQTFPKNYRVWSPYHYSRNNSLVLSDPSGMADYYHRSGYVGNDGIDDGIKYAIYDEVKLGSSDYRNDDGSYNWQALATDSFIFPNEQVRADITTEVYSKFSSDNLLEDGGVVAINDQGQERYIKGEGKAKAVKLPDGRTRFDASDIVQDAINKARANGEKISYYVHSHPSPFTDADQEPTKPDDYNTARNTHTLGLLITATRAIFFTGNSEGPHARIPSEYFKVTTGGK